MASVPIPDPTPEEIAQYESITRQSAQQVPSQVIYHLLYGQPTPPSQGPTP